ncbi:hypothetical protein ZIOFF_068774 [Zingiber officinale]|uniref:Uncharacterized protein n=1 Tax=Zingiber officinale TaxID=94328 RepID=A0A8J5C537_ZINOF|nr:hypothetical protein ZIOFF_068774 [Zingiber officinale]
MTPESPTHPTNCGSEPSTCFECAALTGVCSDKEAGAPEVAVPEVPAAGLVVEVHGNGRVRHERVRVEATVASLQYAAVNLRARVVQVGRQCRIVRGRLRYAPSLLSLYQLCSSPWKQSRGKD